MLRTIISSIVGLIFTFSALAQAQTDSTFNKLYQRYYQLYGTNEKGAFYDASKQLQQYYLDKGDMTAYYRTRQEEIFYEANHEQSSRAVIDANQLLMDMKENGDNHYGIVYRALGIVFESRGNYGMALHYYEEALKNIEPTDSVGLAYTYALLASVNVIRYPDKAMEWCERLSEVITPESPKYEEYLTYKAYVYFYKNDKANFLSTKRELDEFTKKHPMFNQIDDNALVVMEKAFMGRYEEALRLIKDTKDYGAIKRINARIRIYEMMGRLDLALKETNRRRSLRDSLYNDLIFINLNEAAAAAGVIKLNEQIAKEAKKREMWMFVAIILLLIALGLMFSRYFTRRRYQKQILKQNELLEVALDDSKEAERVKSSFINHITHEIRTPLNILTGYIHIIADSGYELDKDTRNELLQGIDQNTSAITSIVNDLLEVSQSESKEHYHRNEQVMVNDLCRSIMMEKEAKNKGRLGLKFQTGLSDDFTITSNYRGIERILRQLLGNALKFTEQGMVELTVGENTDEGVVRFAVTDTGIGIPEEHHEKVFENFYKVDSFKQGMGVGLSMSRKIAVLLGGDITIDKSYHNGTRMILTLPVNMDEDK